MISSEAITFFYALRAEIKEEIYSGNCCLTRFISKFFLLIYMVMWGEREEIEGGHVNFLVVYLDCIGLWVIFAMEFRKFHAVKFSTIKF